VDYTALHGSLAVRPSSPTNPPQASIDRRHGRREAEVASSLRPGSGQPSPVGQAAGSKSLRLAALQQAAASQAGHHQRSNAVKQIRPPPQPGPPRRSRPGRAEIARSCRRARPFTWVKASNSEPTFQLGPQLAECSPWVASRQSQTLEQGKPALRLPANPAGLRPRALRNV